MLRPPLKILVKPDLPSQKSEAVVIVPANLSSKCKLPRAPTADRSAECGDTAAEVHYARSRKVVEPSPANRSYTVHNVKYSAFARIMKSFCSPSRPRAPGSMMKESTWGTTRTHHNIEKAELSSVKIDYCVVIYIPVFRFR